VYSNKAWGQLGLNRGIHKEQNDTSESALDRPKYAEQSLWAHFSEPDDIFRRSVKNAEWFTVQMRLRGVPFWATLCPLDAPLDLFAASLCPVGQPRGEYYMLCATQEPFGARCYTNLPNLRCPFHDVFLAGEHDGHFVALVNGRPCTVKKSAPGEPELPNPLRRCAAEGHVWTLTAEADGFEWSSCGLAPKAVADAAGAPGKIETEVELASLHRRIGQVPAEHHAALFQALDEALTRFGA